MTTVDIDSQATPSLNDPHDFITEASTLNIRPNKFPAVIKPTGGTVGNGLDFIATKQDTFGVQYTQANGCLRLVVYND